MVEPCVTPTAVVAALSVPIAPVRLTDHGLRPGAGTAVRLVVKPVSRPSARLVAGPGGVRVAGRAMAALGHEAKVLVSGREVAVAVLRRWDRFDCRWHLFLLWRLLGRASSRQGLV